MKIIYILMLLLLSSCGWNRIYYYNESYDPQFQRKKELKEYQRDKVYYPVRVGQVYEFIQKHHISKSYLKGLKTKVRYTYDNNLYSRVYISKGTKFKIIGLCRHYLSGLNEVGGSVLFVAKILNGKYKNELFMAKSGSINFLGGFRKMYLNPSLKHKFSSLYYLIKNGFKEIRELGRIPCFNGNDKNKVVKLIKDSPYPLPTKKVRSWLFFSKEVVDYSWSEDKDLGKDLGSIYYNLKEAKKKEKVNKNKSN